MGLALSYNLRRERQRRRLRSLRKSFELTRRTYRLDGAGRDTVLLFSTLRNEAERLEYFLTYYRKLGIGHFCFVDNGSTDGSREFLERQGDCSVWTTEASYKSSNFGMDWLNHLINRYAHNRWVLTVDVDEFLVYPHHDTRPLSALVQWLDSHELTTFGAMMVDMYPRGPIEDSICLPGSSPFESLCWFDAGNYSYSVMPRYRNLWIQGGPRQRCFFSDNPAHAPALNKIPLVKWRRGFVYASATHALLPRRLNMTYDESGGEKPCGCLLHAKLMRGLHGKSIEELERKEHFANGREYKAYLRGMTKQNKIWTIHSSKFENWRNLQECGLMSAGGWI